jgi:hypothetical protein
MYISIFSQGVFVSLYSSMLKVQKSVESVDACTCAQCYTCILSRGIEEQLTDGYKHFHGFVTKFLVIV